MADRYRQSRCEYDEKKGFEALVANDRIGEKRPLPSVDVLFGVAPVFLSEFELLDLPGRRLGKFLPELDSSRTLVVGESLSSELDEVVFRQRRALAGNDERLRGLTPLLVGDEIGRAHV